MLLAIDMILKGATMIKAQPSIKLFIIILCSVGMLAAAAISTVSFFAFNNFNQSKKEILVATELQTNMNTMQNAFLTLTLRQQRITSSVSIEQFSEIQTSEEVYSNFSFSKSVFAESASEIEGLNDLTSAFHTTSSNLIELDANLSQETSIVLSGEHTLNTTIDQLQLNVASVLKHTESLVGKIAFQEKRAQRGIKKLMRQADKFEPVDFINQITDKINNVTSGDLARLITESNKLRIDILRLSNFANQMIASDSIDMVTSIQQNQVSQAMTSAQASLSTISSMLAENASLTAILKNIEADFVYMRNIFDKDSADSLYEITTSVLENRIKRAETLKQVAIVLGEIQYLFSEIEKVSKEFIEASQLSAKATSSRASTTNIIATSVATLILFVVGFVVIQLAARPMEKATKAMWAIAQGDGDLTQRLPSAKVKEINEFAEAFNVLIAKMQGLISNILTSVNSVMTVVNDTTQSAQQTRNHVTQQRKETDSLQHSISEINETVKQIAVEASKAFDNAQNTNALTSKGKDNINDVLSAMDSLALRIDNATLTMEKLADESNSVDQVLDVIKSVADKTNLLALNAAIEAARAGEQGRGFAVVADEVRVLASKTQDSTTEISEILNRFQYGIEEVKTTMTAGNEKIKEDVVVSKAAVQIFNDVLESVDEVSKLNQSIAVSTEQQAATVNSINNGLSSISEISQETQACTEKNDTSNRKLQNVADNLHNLVAQFKV